RDRAYGVGEVVALAAEAGLKLAAFLPPLCYDPATYLPEGELLQRARALPWPEQAALAEELAGNLKTHVFDLREEDNEDGGPPAERSAARARVLREVEPQALATILARQQGLKANLGGIEKRFSCPPLASHIVRLSDGRRTVRQIFEA